MFSSKLTSKTTLSPDIPFEYNFYLLIIHASVKLSNINTGNYCVKYVFDTMLPYALGLP